MSPQLGPWARPCYPDPGSSKKFITCPGLHDDDQAGIDISVLLFLFTENSGLRPSKSRQPNTGVIKIQDRMIKANY